MDDRDADFFLAAIAAADRARRRQDLLFAQDLFGRPRAHALGEDRALSERGAAPGMMTSPNEGRGVPEKVDKTPGPSGTPKMSPFRDRPLDPLDKLGEFKLEEAFQKAKAAVTADARYAGLASSIEDLPIIFVPLRADGKRPYSGQHHTGEYYAGSMLKVAAMYAAFQLRHAVNELAATLDPTRVRTPDDLWAAAAKEFDDQIANGSKVIVDSGIGRAFRIPTYKRVFTATPDSSGKFTVKFRSDADPKLDFSGHLEKMVKDSKNASAGFCIQQLGYGTINGALEKAGLFEPRFKLGMWLAGDYLQPKAVVDAQGDNDTKESFALGISGWTTVRIPCENDVPKTSKQATTCIDAARMLVLLADRKLVKDIVAGSGAADMANPEMMAMLGRGVTGAAPSVVGRLTPPTFTVQQSKIGLGTLGTTGNCITNVGCIRSEMLIVERRAPDKLRFVVVWQNMKDPKPQSDPGSERWRLRDLIQKTIDGYIP